VIDPTRHLTTALLSAAALVATCLTPAAADDPAEFQEPQITAVASAGVKAGSPATSYTYSLPALVGVTGKGATKFAAAINAIVTAEERSLAKSKACTGSNRSDTVNRDLKLSYAGGVFEERYASVTVIAERARSHCKFYDYAVPHSVTIDLETGRSVALSKFALDNGYQLDTALIRSLRAQNPKCKSDKTLRQVRPPLGPFDGWHVSDSGLRVYFAGSQEIGETCSIITAFASWESVLQPADYNSEKTVTSYWAKGLKKTDKGRFGYDGSVAVVRSRGAQIAVFEWNLTKNTGGCKVGLRAEARAVLWSTADSMARSTIKLTGDTASAVPTTVAKGAHKMSQAERRALLTARNRLDSKAVAKACGL
jgi:hypothetical protein